MSPKVLDREALVRALEARDAPALRHVLGSAYLTSAARKQLDAMTRMLAESGPVRALALAGQMVPRPAWAAQVIEALEGSSLYQQSGLTPQVRPAGSAPTPRPARPKPAKVARVVAPPPAQMTMEAAERRERRPARKDRQMSLMEQVRADAPMDVRAAAAYLQMSRATVFNRLKDSDLPAHKAGRTLRFYASELDEWLKRRGR
jgi:excisionase family DNA binding protein